MRNLLILLTVASAGLAGCETPESGLASTPATDLVPEDVFVSEHGVRVPAKDRELFLECVADAKDWDFMYGRPRTKKEHEESCSDPDVLNPPPMNAAALTHYAHHAGGDRTPDEAACVYREMGFRQKMYWPDGRLAVCDRPSVPEGRN